MEKTTNGNWKITKRNEKKYLNTNFTRSVHFSFEMIMRLTPDAKNISDLRAFVYEKLGVSDLVPKEEPKADNTPTEEDKNYIFMNNFMNKKNITTLEQLRKELPIYAKNAQLPIDVIKSLNGWLKVNAESLFKKKEEENFFDF